MQEVRNHLIVVQERKPFFWLATFSKDVHSLQHVFFHIYYFIRLFSCINITRLYLSSVSQYTNKTTSQCLITKLLKEIAFMINLGTVLLTWFLIASGIRESKCTKFTITNNCNETIWPGVTPNNFSGGGFALRPNQSAVFTAPPAWNGRIWARTGCDFDRNGNGTCQTGACGSALQCTGPGHPPASIAEFTLGDIDYYDVSLVDGFNLPIVVKPVGGKGNCSSAGCDGDLRPNCPQDLTLKSDGKIIACQSACNVFNKDEYCCRGAFSTPTACLPTNYSRIFKTACPAAYSFAYDDRTSIITCKSATDYMVTFCSSRNQTQCTYHDNKLTCNGASGMLKLKQISQAWKNLLMMAVAVAISIGQFL